MVYLLFCPDTDQSVFHIDTVAFLMKAKGVPKMPSIVIYVLFSVR